MLSVQIIEPSSATALAAVAAKMNLKEDVLILFTTSHGDPNSGLAYRDGEKGVGMIAPSRLASLLDDIGGAVLRGLDNRVTLDQSLALFFGEVDYPRGFFVGLRQQPFPGEATVQPVVLVHVEAQEGTVHA